MLLMLTYLQDRLKSFYEGGEREAMNEQIMVLQNKVGRDAFVIVHICFQPISSLCWLCFLHLYVQLLEALDWKLMNGPDLVIIYTLLIFLIIIYTSCWPHLLQMSENKFWLGDGRRTKWWWSSVKTCKINNRFLHSYAFF